MSTALLLTTNYVAQMDGGSEKSIAPTSFYSMRSCGGPPLPKYGGSIKARNRTMVYRKSLTAVALPLMLCLWTQQTYAWEKDVHFGLTEWLAVQAGFSESNADSLARADQALDDGHFSSAIWAVLFHIIIDGDPEASREVQRWHFPSGATIPGDPNERRVIHDSVDAQREARNVIDDTTPESPGKRLEDFGNALHPFQDSWSHEGTPDTPFRPILVIQPQLTWGHPKDRGGWDSHDADLTWLHVGQTQEMA